MAGGNEVEVQVGAVVTVFNDSHPRGMWRLGVVEELIDGADCVTRGARVQLFLESYECTILFSFRNF